MDQIMGKIENFVKKTAETMAENKERAIRAAIDQYFEGGFWTEVEVREIAVMECHQDGTEIFKLGGKQVLMFGPITPTTEVDGNKVICQYTQDITVLNGGDNDS